MGEAITALVKSVLLEIDFAISIYLETLDNDRRRPEAARAQAEQSQAEAVDFECEEVRDGILRTKSFELAIVDLFMPVKEGISTIMESIKPFSGGSKNLPSGQGLDYALALGANDAMGKPFSSG